MGEKKKSLRWNSGFMQFVAIWNLTCFICFSCQILIQTFQKWKKWLFATLLQTNQISWSLPYQEYISLIHPFTLPYSNTTSEEKTEPRPSPPAGAKLSYGWFVKIFSFTVGPTDFLVGVSVMSSNNNKKKSFFTDPFLNQTWKKTLFLWTLKFWEGTCGEKKKRKKFDKF